MARPYAEKARKSLAGLMVDYSPEGPLIREKGHGKHPVSRAPAGYYVYVRDYVGGNLEWVAVLVGTFYRKKDALIAAQSLTQAGLDSVKALKDVSFSHAREIACRDLQW